MDGTSEVIFGVYRVTASSTDMSTQSHRWEELLV